MQDNEIFQRVLTIVKPYVKNQESFDQAQPSTRFIEDLRINSARLVDIILAMEDEFHLSISDQEAEEIQTLGKAVDVIKQKAQQ
jgi:acyl carrier protein